MNFIRLLLALAAGSAIVMADRPNPLTITSSIPGQFQLTWLADNLRPYQMENSPDLNVWTDLGDVVVGTGSTQGMLVTSTEPKYFYRLREGAMRPGFDDIAMARGDDTSYPGSVPIGFTVNYYGESFSNCYVNNNGNITFDGPLGLYTPVPIGGIKKKIIAPFWADVDTEGAASDVVRFSDNSVSVTTLNDRPAFGVSYRNLGYFYQRTDKLNSFQVILIDRSDIATGDFDIEFNYNCIQWESGVASGGVNGIGGSSARSGGSNTDGSYFEYKGSGQSLAFLDTNPATDQPNYLNGLIYQSYNSSCPGRIVLPIRNGRLADGISANAGADLNLSESAGATFQLQGSIDPTNSSGVSHSWTQVSGPGQAQFSDIFSLTPDVTIPEPGEYEFILTATKEGGDFLITDIDTVIVVHPAVYEIYSGFYELHSPAPLSLTLDQEVATAPTGVSFLFHWTQSEGQPATIADPTILHPTVTLPGPGSYRFQMTATTNHSSPFVYTTDTYVEYYE